jgi:hypothetical protein
MTFEDALEVANKTSVGLESIEHNSGFIVLGYMVCKSKYNGYTLISNIGKEHWESYKSRVESGELVVARAYYCGGNHTKCYLDDCIGIYKKDPLKALTQ